MFPRRRCVRSAVLLKPFLARKEASACVDPDILAISEAEAGDDCGLDSGLPEISLLSDSDDDDLVVADSE